MRTLISLFLVCWTASAVELMVRIQDKPALKDEDEQRRGRTTTGMVICVRPDGHKWGKQMGPPQYAIVKLPGVDKTNWIKFTLPEYQNETNLYRARMYKLDTNRINSTVLTALKSGSYTVTAAQASTASTYLKTNMLSITAGTFDGP